MIFDIKNNQDIECRQLNDCELDQLIKDAPDSETRNLLRLSENNVKKYIDDNAIEKNGIVINSKPIYLGFLIFSCNKYQVCTVVNSDVKEQLTLFKIAKKELNKWKNKYGEIYATMEKVNKKNMKWTERLGFVPIKETNDIITYILKGE